MLKDVDGRERYVAYVADKKGFRAEIKTNEPGTGSVDSGDAIYNGPDPHGGSYTHVPSGWSGDSWKKDYHWMKKDDSWKYEDKHDSWKPKESWKSKEIYH